MIDYVIDTSGVNEVIIFANGGDGQVKKYQKHMPLILTFDSNEVKELLISDRKGKSYVGYGYYGNADQLKAENPLSGLELSKNYQLGEIKTIRIAFTVPEEYDSARLHLNLPACFQLMDGNATVQGAPTFIVADMKQGKIELGHLENEVEIILRVRSVLPGKFEMEPIVLCGSKPGQYMISKPLELSVN